MVRVQHARFGLQGLRAQAFANAVKKCSSKLKLCFLADLHARITAWQLAITLLGVRNKEYNTYVIYSLIPDEPQ